MSRYIMKRGKETTHSNWVRELKLMMCSPIAKSNREPQCLHETNNNLFLSIVLILLCRSDTILAIDFLWIFFCFGYLAAHAHEALRAIFTLISMSCYNLTLSLKNFVVFFFFFWVYVLRYFRVRKSIHE